MFKNHLYRAGTRLCSELLPLALLTALVWNVGSARLEGWDGPAGSLSNDLFVPAIMMNAGRGFTNIEPSDIPELRAFLDFRAQHFDLALISDAEEIPLHPYQEFHRYLIYSVALAWRAMDVHWSAVITLILMYFCMASWCVYGICRLAMNPVLSFVAALGFVYAQPVLFTLPILRDFVKAPFILALLLPLGMSFRWRFLFKYYLLIAAILGLVMGVGLGFRRDMMVFLPVCLTFLALCRLVSPRRPVAVRLAAIALFVAVYLLSGWPIHASLRAHGYVAAHDTIMGFASFSDHEIGILAPASYEKHYLLNDLFCTLKAHDAAKRGLTFSVEEYALNSNEPEFDLRMKQAYVMEMVKTFPADMLTRAYASVLRILTAVITSQRPVFRQIENYGVWFTLAGLLLVARRNPVKAWLILGLLCFFCGYTSIQFAIRHVFHMSFVPYFFAGLTAQQLWTSCQHLIRRRCPEDAATNGPSWKRQTLTVVTWVAITFALFQAPLAVARAYQARVVRNMLDDCVNAPLEAVPSRTVIWNERALFVPEEGRPCYECQTMGLIFDIHTRYLVAAFKQVEEPLDFLLVYEWEGISWDFSAPGTYNLADSDKPVDLLYFFPVHETTTCTDWNRFMGLSLPQHQAQYFAGFYQATHLDEFGLLVNMIVPNDREHFITAQHLRIPWGGSDWSTYRIYEEFEPFPADMRIQGNIVQGELDEAIAAAKDILDSRPGSVQFTFLLVEALDKAGRAEEARERYMELLLQNANCFPLHARLNRYFDERGGALRRIEEWGRIVAAYPELTCAALYLDRARLETLNGSPNTL